MSIMSSDSTLSVISRIRHAWEPCTVAGKQDVGSEALRGLSVSLLSSMLDPIVAEYDVITDRLGRIFVHGDERFEADLQSIAQGELDHLHKLVGGQTSEDSSGAAAFPRAELRSWEEEAQGLACRASEKTVQALHDLASRLGYVVPSSNRDPLVSTLPQSSYVDIKAPYCRGALRLQKSGTDVYSVITQQSSEQDYSCNFCSLEISDFRSCSSSYAEEDWFLLASCHIQACKSRKDRRVPYRCFACSLSLYGHSEIEPSAAVFRDHLDACQFMKVYKQSYQKSCEVGKQQSSPVSQLQPNFSPRPPVLSDALAQDSSASLDTKHVSQVSNNTEHRSIPPHDKREAVHASNGNRPATVPRQNSRQISSPISADQAVPTAPPLQNLKPLRMNTRTGERRTRNEGPVVADLISFSSGFASTDSPAAPIASISQCPDNHLIPMPVPAAPRTSHPTNQAIVSRHPDNVPLATPVLNPPRIAHPSPANQTRISRHPDNLLPSVPVPNSRRSPKIEVSTSQRPGDLLSAVPVSSPIHTSRHSIKNRADVFQYPDSLLSATSGSSPLYTNRPYTNGPYANGASISQYPSPPYTNPPLPTNEVGISQYYPDNLPLSTPVPSPPNTGGPPGYRVSNSSQPDDDPTIIGNKRRLQKTLRKPPRSIATTASPKDATQYRPVPARIPSTMSGGYSFGTDAGVVAEDNNIRQLQELGISSAHAKSLLRMTGGDPNEAETLVFNEWIAAGVAAAAGDDSPPLGHNHYHHPPPPPTPPSAPVNNEPCRRRSRSRNRSLSSFWKLL